MLYFNFIFVRQKKSGIPSKWVRNGNYERRHGRMVLGTVPGSVPYAVRECVHAADYELDSRQSLKL